MSILCQKFYARAIRRNKSKLLFNILNVRLSGVVLALFVVANFSFSKSVNHWESIIQVGDTCSYLIPAHNIGTAWTTKDFNDSQWTRGQSGLGYGDDDDNTELPDGTKSVYMRFTFTIYDLAQIAGLLLDMDYDDGFVAYLNGSEIARSNNIQDPLSWDMQLDNNHEATLYNGIPPERFQLHEFFDLLTAGENVLALQVHNRNAQSSDMSANVFLSAGLTTDDTLYRPVPDWFQGPVTFTDFNLPLMVINTNGQPIADEQRIVVDMGLINNGVGSINSVDDAWNEYAGTCAIEQRGESSMGFAKWSFSIELQNEDGSNDNASLLGLPEENDFVLHGPYSDKTMLKNALSYELFRRTGRWSPRTRFIELMINDSYEGIYVLTEKLKRDENRVDIDKLTADDISPLDMSGGYILRRDKKGKLPSAAWWTSPIDQPFHERMWYEYYDPEYDELTLKQKAYIRGWMRNFDSVLSSEDFADPQDGYRKYINVTSFIDMMIVNEISKGIDNYLFSTYFYKENDADGGRLVAGPPWDYNLGYGNVNYGDDWNARETWGWCYTQWSRVYWYERLMEDDSFHNQLQCRWTQFRETIFSDDRVIAFIDSCTTYLGDAVDRNFARFSTLGEYVWPALEPVPETYDEEIEMLKSWLMDRLAWMDSQWLTTEVCQPQPPTAMTLSNLEIRENQPAGVEIGYLNTRDPDSDEHEYKLVAGQGDTDNAKFRIKSNKLSTRMTFDADLHKSLSIRIQAADESGEYFQDTFKITVLNDGPSRIDLNVEPDFELKQNYPNPFNPSTTIRFSLPNPGHVTLSIYTMTGQKVRTLIDRPLQAGWQHIVWDGKDAHGMTVVNGIYVYQLESDFGVRKRKMIVIK
jgi:hypothetical protein